MFVISSGELDRNPQLGKTITCPHCGKEHPIEKGKDEKTGKEDSLLQFYTCGEKSYLAGINNKAINFK